MNKHFFSIADDIKSDISKQDEPNVTKPDETIPSIKCGVFIKQIVQYDWVASWVHKYYY